MYWEITPHKNNDYDSAVMPANTNDDHIAALEYAQEVLDQLFDSTAYGVKEITLKMELKEGNAEDVCDPEV